MEDSTLQDIFVGREDEQRLYHDFLAHDTPWVLIITGLGGIGKSTLLDHLARETPASICTCKLDFNESALRTEPLLILQRLSEQIRPSGNAQQIDELEKAIQRNLEQLEQIRKIKLPSSSGNGANTNNASIQEVQLDALEDDAATKEIRRQMRELATESFYDLLGTLLLDQLILMFDTCEWLNEPEGWETGQWVFNELIPEIRSRLLQNDQRCSAVLVSRVKPQLARIDRQDQQHLPLSMLTKEAVFEYLAHAGMHDPALSQRVYDITHGHALSVSIIGAICQEQGAPSLTEEDFPLLQKEFTEKASMQFVDERILNRLQPPYLELTRYGVLLRVFNLPLLQTVFFDIEALEGTDAPGIFEHLIRYPYIEPRGNNYYAFHELLREVIAEQVQQQNGPEQEQWKRYHQQALEHFTRVAPSSPEWYYHAIASNEERGMTAWLAAIQKAGGPQMKNTLLQVTYDSALRLSPKATAIRDYEQGRFKYESMGYLGTFGYMQQVHDLRKEALTNFENARQNFKQVQDSCGEALAQQAIDVLQKPGKGQAATLKSYTLACLSPSEQQLPAPTVLTSPYVLNMSAPTALAQPIPSQKRGLRLKRRSILLIVLALLIAVAGVVAALVTTRPARPYPSYLPGSGDLTLFDPLHDNSAGNNWDSYTSKGQGCVFEGGAYHALEQNSNTFNSCATSQQFDNFALTLQMTIIKGTCGGVIFRGDTYSTKLYFFDICQDGTYSLYLYVDSSAKDGKTLVSDSSPAIYKGLNRANLIDVLAYSSYLYLSINGQFVASVIDGTYSTGQIGFSADNHQIGSTEVMFNDLAVWTVSNAPTTGPQDTYTKAIHGKPDFQDHLSAYNIVSDWDINDSCNFTGGAYHVTDSSKTNLGWCVGNGMDLRSNFVFQVQMTIIKGDAGGIFFRGDSTNTMFYFFKVDRDGSYFLYHTNSDGSYDELLFDTIASRISTGLGHPILLAVMVQGSFLNLFADGQFIASINDATYSSGSSGLVAEDDGQPTNVAFNNAQVWNL